MTTEKLTELQQAVTTAATIAKDLVADPAQGRSPFAAALRSALDHSQDLLAQQQQWLTAQPKP